MNVTIVERGTDQVIVRYEIHRGTEDYTPPETEYFDDAWQRAIGDDLVDADHRDRYRFLLQNPTNLYESSV